MKNAFLASLFINAVIGFFLLQVVFLDSNPNLLEGAVYYLLALLPFLVSALTLSKSKSFSFAFAMGFSLYVLSAAILRYLNVIDSGLHEIPTFYVTGMNGVSFGMAFFVMGIHALISLLSLYFMSRRLKK